jgi:ABC-type antimicrobial peptide transport system permease subunit
MSEHKWIRIRTEKTNQVYYHNHELNQTVWHLPPGHSCPEENKSITAEQGVKMGLRKNSLKVPDSRTAESKKNVQNTMKQNKNSSPNKKNTTTTTTKGGGDKLIMISESKKNVQNKMKQNKNSSPNKNNITTTTTRGGGDELIMISNPQHSKKGKESNATTTNRQANVTSTQDSTSRPRPSTFHSNPVQKQSLCAHVHPKNVSASVFFLWLVPVLVCVSINIYYFQIVTLWGYKQRPSQWDKSFGNVTTITYKSVEYRDTQIIQLHSGYQANLTYSKFGFVYQTTNDLRQKAMAKTGEHAPTCRNDFKRQAGSNQQELCEAYCTGCVLGGDTFIYPHMPLYVAGFWTISVILSAIFLPIISKCLKIDKQVGRQSSTSIFGGYTTTDARVYLLLLLSFLIFAVTLFLIHHGRVIDVSKPKNNLYPPTQTR